MAIKKQQQLVQQVRRISKKNRSFYKVIHISLISQLQKNIMDHKIFAKRCITSLPSQQHMFQPTICFIDAHRLPQDCDRQVQSLRDLPNLLNATKCQRSPSHSRFHRSVLCSAFPPRTPRTSIALNPPIYAPHKNATKLRNSSQSQRKKRCPSRNKNGNSLLSGTLFGCETIKSLTEFARTFLTPSTLITQ